MKRTLAAVLALLLMLGAAALAEGYVYLTGSAAVRTGPGLGYSKAAQLNAGSTVDYLQQAVYDSRAVLWYRVGLANGGSGWVQSTHAVLTDEAGFATYASGAGASGFGLLTGEVTVSGDVNIRSGPGLGHPILNTMFKGETAVYLGVSATDNRGVTWYNVQFEDTSGWVSSVYAELTGSPEFAQTVVEASGGNSNVRTGPGLGYASVGTLFKGETADYLGVSSIDERGVTWYCIDFDGQTGWVSSKYTEIVY